MCAYIPRSHYLHIHDAARKVLGADAELSAFVKHRAPFQCDMCINAPCCDPDLAERNPHYVRDFAVRIQEHLGGLCEVSPHFRRFDAVFRDKVVLRVALGAPKRWLNNLQQTSEINEERDWRKRNRLRISLGFDEQIFTETRTKVVNVAAGFMYKKLKRYVKKRELLSMYADMNEYYEATGSDLDAVLPPITYWQAHAFVLQKHYPSTDPQVLSTTIENAFARYYGEFPFDNPYCTGEDLNTMRSAELICMAFKRLSINDLEHVVCVQGIYEKRD